MPRLASVPFSATAAADADEGKPAMVSKAVPEQVSAYELIAGQVRRAVRAAGGCLGRGKTAPPVQD